MIKIRKDNDEKIVTIGLFEEIYKGLGYEEVSNKSNKYDHIENKNSNVQNIKVEETYNIPNEKEESEVDKKQPSDSKK